MYNKLYKAVKDYYSNYYLDLCRKGKTEGNDGLAELKRHVSVMIKNLNSESYNKNSEFLSFYAKLAKSED